MSVKKVSIQLDFSSLLVGVDNSIDSEGVSNQDKALWLERGTLTSEPRPFLSIASKLIASDKEFLDNYISDPEKAGRRAVTIVKEVMNTYAFKPLRPSTIKDRQKKGNFSIQPTVDKGDLEQAINFEVIR